MQKQTFQTYGAANAVVHRPSLRPDFGEVEEAFTTCQVCRINMMEHFSTDEYPSKNLMIACFADSSKIENYSEYCPQRQEYMWMEKQSMQRESSNDGSLTQRELELFEQPIADPMAMEWNLVLDGVNSQLLAQYDETCQQFQGRTCHGTVSVMEGSR